MSDEQTMAKHPYWCDDCGGRAPFTMPGSPIDHSFDCPRFGEDAMQVFRDACAFCKAGGTIL